MTSRERVVRTLNHQCVDRAPRDLWALAGVEMYHREEHQEILRRFPLDLTRPEYRYGRAERAWGTPGEIGEYSDVWGCVWRVLQPGTAGEVKRHPLAEWSNLHDYRLPWELLDEADLSEVNRSCAETEKFVRVGTEARPFERAQFLRGTEALLIDLAYGTPEAFRLLQILHDFYCREMEMWAATDVDGVSFMDDWGTETSLIISPDAWRTIFKPMYRDYCEILHRRGKYAFFHSDGWIDEIFPDLVEIGVDAVNSQLFCMDIESLGARFAGKIAFWGEIDRRLLAFGSPDDVRSAVRRVRAALDRGRGGVFAQCEWGLDTPAENIAAVFEEWEAPHPSIESDPW